jgi:predicted amidohydrolase
MSSQTLFGELCADMNARRCYVAMTQMCHCADVRLWLVALRCEKGDIAGNARAHQAALLAAARGAADLVVFPEMSLTGSVDPVAHPERLVPLDGVDVARFVASTRDQHATVVFGIAERDGDAAHITQCVARRGALVGAYRKRHLGEDEAGFAAGTQPRCFEHDGLAFGVTICAESSVDGLFEEVADAGARLVVLCAAPGLYGRRTDDTAFADGLAWWESAGLADMQRHARRRATWCAVATQAGATHDEDFPGLAAVIAPDGEVVARTRDWREGTLTFDVPLL